MHHVKPHSHLIPHQQVLAEATAVVDPETVMILETSVFSDINMAFIQPLMIPGVYAQKSACLKTSGSGDCHGLRGVLPSNVAFCMCEKTV